MRVSLQPAHSASTTVSTCKGTTECIPTVGRPEGLHEGQPTAGTLSKHNGRGGGVKMEKWGSQNEVEGRSKKSRGEVKMKWGGGQKRVEAGSWGRSKKSRGDVKKKWPYNKNTLNLQGVKIERGGCQKKAGEVRKKQGGSKKKLGPIFLIVYKTTNCRVCFP